jgi:hypothetical protein
MEKKLQHIIIIISLGQMYRKSQLRTTMLEIEKVENR